MVKTPTILMLYLIAHYIVKYTNTLLGYFTKDPIIFNTKDYEWTKKFRDNYNTILQEFLTYNNNNICPYYQDILYLTSSCDIYKKWRSLFLRAYNKNTDIIKYFPKTMELINSVPCTLAFFSILEPGAYLSPHEGVYKGVIRYHLGLITPADSNNCYINIGNRKLSWNPGEDMMFDDMYLHEVHNNTNCPRLILFLDIKRKFNNIFIDTINDILLYFISSNDIVIKLVSNSNSFNKIE